MESAISGKQILSYTKNGSIQAAVNAARPGMLIKIEPGTYAEAVTVTQPGIKLIGLTNSNGEGVIIQNPGTEETGITVVQGANGFSLENIVLKILRKMEFF